MIILWLFGPLIPLFVCIFGFDLLWQISDLFKVCFVAFAITVVIGIPLGGFETRKGFDICTIGITIVILLINARDLESGSPFAMVILLGGLVLIGYCIYDLKILISEERTAKEQEQKAKAEVKKTAKKEPKVSAAEKYVCSKRNIERDSQYYLDRRKKLDLKKDEKPLDKTSATPVKHYYPMGDAAYAELDAINKDISKDMLAKKTDESIVSKAESDKADVKTLEKEDKILNAVISLAGNTVGTKCNNTVTPKITEVDNKVFVPSVVPNTKINDDDLKFFVSVSFDYGIKTYDYICDDTNVFKGDKVLVPTRRGTKEATVVDCHWEFMDDMPLPARRYKKVIKVYRDDEDEEEETEVVRSHYAYQSVLDKALCDGKDEDNEKEEEYSIADKIMRNYQEAYGVQTEPYYEEEQPEWHFPTPEELFDNPALMLDSRVY